MKPEHDADVGYFSYLFKAHRYIGALQATADFIRDGQDLTLDNFRRVDLPLVPYGEQKAIARFIAELLQAAESKASKFSREISLLREYRTRLINEVVTGKLDVREVAARLPEEVEEAKPIDEADGDRDEGGEAEELAPLSEEAQA